MISKIARALALAIGTGLGSGYFPIAPGTVGSAVGLALYAALVRLGAVSRAFSLGWVLTLAVVFAAGWASAWYLERRYGPDNRRIVIDEVWGMLISLFLVTPGVGQAIAGFLLFRLFDIIKPFPGRLAEKVGGGAGVMLDDGVAGVYACIVLRVFGRLLG